MLWRYHLGVHKTATTHLQAVLRSQREQLLARGIDYIPLEELRDVIEPILWTRAFPRLRFRRLVRSSAPVAIVSEENWLGRSEEGCVFPLYPALERRLTVVARPNSVAFLSIRNPADFAASAYSEALRHTPNEVSLEATRSMFLSNGSPWLGLVQRIRRFFPRLQVWRYESYRENEQTYISMLAGTRVTVPNIADPIRTERLPSETIEALERIRLAGRPVPKAGTLRPPTNPTRFEMFNEDEKLKLTQAYHRDLEALKRMGILV